MANRLKLIPAPRSISRKGDRGGTFPLAREMFVVLDPHPVARHIFAAERFAIDAEWLTESDFHIRVATEAIEPRREIRTRFDPAAAKRHEQGYRLTISEEGIEIAAPAAAGIFYGFQTLTQIIRQCSFDGSGRRSPLKLPCVMIEDWPDFERRGVYHDCARGKIPTVRTLLQLIDELAHLKYNEFQLYIENGFEFRRHPGMWEDTTPLTAEDLLLLDAACRARHMDFVPSLTSLGHFEKILSRPAYRHLAEAEPEQLRAMGAPCWVDQPWSLCVTDPGSRTLLKEMYDEFLPNFTSGQFNICCDEAYDLGRVRSKALADKIGVGQMYVEWVRYCNELAKSHGKSIQMWGDIILNHPELIGQLPEDAVLLEWGYEADHSFEKECAVFAERLRPTQSFYVCPGTSSWLTLGSRSKNALENIQSAARAGLKHGAKGLLVTDWGDHGHQQMLGVSMLGFAYGAAAGWNLSKNSEFRVQNSELMEAISLHVFEDPAGDFAELAFDLGLTYERFGWRRKNASLEWYLFREKWEVADFVNRAAPKELARVIAACEKLVPKIKRARLGHPEGAKIQAELLFTCEEIIHACRRTELRQAWLAADPARRNAGHEVLSKKPARALPKDFGRRMKAMRGEIGRLEKEFAKLWLARNKVSRLRDVRDEFRRMGREYERFAR